MPSQHGARRAAAWRSGHQLCGILTPRLSLVACAALACAIRPGELGRSYGAFCDLRSVSCGRDRCHPSPSGSDHQTARNRKSDIKVPSPAAACPPPQARTSTDTRTHTFAPPALSWPSGRTVEASTQLRGRTPLAAPARARVQALLVMHRPHRHLHAPNQTPARRTPVSSDPGASISPDRTNLV